MLENALCIFCAKSLPLFVSYIIKNQIEYFQCFDIGYENYSTSEYF